MAWQLLMVCGLLAAPALAPAADTQDGPADLPALVRKADTNYLSRNWTSAAAGYERIVKLNPTNGLYWHRLGDSLLNAKRYDESLAPLEQALALGGFQPAPPRWLHRGEVAYALALAHAGLADRDEALQWTRTSLKQGLRNIRRFRDDRFAELRKDPEFRELVSADVDNVDGLSRDERFRRDLQFAVQELKRVHYSPFRATPEAEIDRVVAELDRDIPNLNDDQVFVRLMAVIRLFGDAHTRMLREQPLIPVAFFLYPEGLHVFGATSEHADLVGAKVLTIGGVPVEEAFERTMAIVPVENPMTEKWEAAKALQSMTVLRGLGLAPAEGPVTLEIEDAAG